MRATARLIAVAVLVLTLGLHWALLQTVAWTGMLIGYSQSATLSEAVAKTFDGKHPCRLCQVVQQGRAEEKEQGSPHTPPTPKLDLSLPPLCADFEFTSVRQSLEPVKLTASVRRYEPPKPRPRGVFLDSFV